VHHRRRRGWSTERRGFSAGTQTAGPAAGAGTENALCRRLGHAHEVSEAQCQAIRPGSRPGNSPISTYPNQPSVASTTSKGGLSFLCPVESQRVARDPIDVDVRDSHRCATLALRGTEPQRAGDRTTRRRDLRQVGRIRWRSRGHQQTPETNRGELRACAQQARQRPRQPGAPGRESETARRETGEGTANRSRRAGDRLRRAGGSIAGR